MRRRREARRPEGSVLYPVDGTAARHGASSTEDTDDPSVAYAPFPGYRPAPAPSGLPWN